MPENEIEDDKERDEDTEMTDAKIDTGDARDNREDAFIETDVDETGRWSVLDNSEGFDPYNSGARRFPKKK